MSTDNQIQRCATINITKWWREYDGTFVLVVKADPAEMTRLLASNDDDPDGQYDDGTPCKGYVVSYGMKVGPIL